MLRIHCLLQQPVVPQFQGFRRVFRFSGKHYAAAAKYLSYDSARRMIDMLRLYMQLSPQKLQVVIQPHDREVSSNAGFIGYFIFGIH
jgi:hypothetical protein